MGISHSWNGTVLTITSDSGTSSADLKGDMGIRGPQGIPGEQFIPEKGEDYFTPAEIAEIREEIKTDLTPYIDEKVEAASSELTDYANANFAPSGYGVGLETPEKMVNDCNLAINTGTYKYATGAANAPMQSGEWLEVNSYSATFKHQRAFISYYSRTIAERWMISGEWQEWEWVNPPMELGVEYRTTKRYKGRPVYQRLINLGWLAAGDHEFSIEDVAAGQHVRGLGIRLFNYDHEFTSLGTGVTSSQIGRYGSYLTIRFTLAVAHGNIDAYIEYTK